MKVAFDVGPLRPRPAGVGLYVRSMAQELATLLSVGDLVAIGAREDAPGLPEIPTIPRRSLPYPLWVSAVAGRDARRSGADIAHYTDGLAPFFAGVRRSVLTVHDLSIVRHWRTHSVWRLGRAPLAVMGPHLVTRVIADSSATADELVALTRIAASKIDVVPLAPRPVEMPSLRDVDATLHRFGLTHDGFVLVPGTLEPRKNHVRVAQAFSEAKASGRLPRDLQMVLVGGPGWRAGPIREAIDRSPERAAIARLGYVSDSELLALMTGAAVVAYVSIYEGFGLPVLEAMRCGAAVLTSSASSMPEVAGDAAVLADPFDVVAITHGLERAWRDRTSLRAASLDRVEMFSWSLTATQTIDVYRRVLGA